MLREITLPSFGSSIDGATLLQWLVSPGSPVTAGQVIAEIETDKAVAELEAPEDGVIESIQVAEGSEGVEIGSVLALLQVAASSEAPERLSTDDPAESGTPDTRSAEYETKVAIAPAGPANEDSRGVVTERILASPYARKLAREKAIDISVIQGSGPGGRVVSHDLAQASTGKSVSMASDLEALGYAAGSYSLHPSSKMRQAIARGLTQSVREIPQFSLVVDMKFDRVIEHRKTLNAALAKDGFGVSLNDYVIWACARALCDVPAANSSWTDQGIAHHHQANIAMAVAIEKGLVTPVLPAADTLPLREIAVASRELIERAQNLQLKATELQGATFTVSNLGMLGVRSFTSIISRPQACILSVGKVEDRPLVNDGKITMAKIATFTLTCDHRVVDGAVGALFLQKLGEHLNSLIPAS